jgi:hypothetical protein
MSAMDLSTVLELRRTQLEYEKLKAQVEQDVEERYHWRWQRWFWVSTIILAACSALITAILA